MPVVPRKRSIIVAGHKTSVSVEDPFWDAVKDIAYERRLKLSDLVEEIHGRDISSNLSSSIRVAVLEHFRSRSPTLPAGNGPRC